MANEVATHKISTIKLDVDGTPITIKLEEPGDFKFGPIPATKRMLKDRGANTNITVDVNEEEIPFSFTCKFSDDQGVADIWNNIKDGTKNIAFEVAFAGGTETHTLYYVIGTVSLEEREDGDVLTIEGNAQGWSDGTNTYGKVT